MKKKLLISAKVALTVLLVIVIAYSLTAIYAYSYLGGIPTKGAKYPNPSIVKLLWPTIGYPALTHPNGSIVLEVDPSWAEGNGVESVRWNATITASRELLRGVSYPLEFRRAWAAESVRWHSAKHRKIPAEIWNVEFRIPDVLCELYDLKVEGTCGSIKFEEEEPHCVSVLPEGESEFRFVTLADIHVHERGISMPMQPQTDKGISPDGEPLFFRDAIEQVNLIRPEFVVMLGDYVFAQRRAGEFLPEFQRFYDSLEYLDVPTFILPGNHDLYVNRVDQERVWEENIGPLFYSFDFEGYHFTAVDTYDWPRAERVVMKKLGNVFVYARKWQGQIRGASDERNPRTYTGELAWLRDDLKKNSSARLRIVFLHHCPFTPQGKGISYKNERFAGVFTLGGKGKGAMALRELFSTYKVNLVMSGHIHEDHIGQAQWKDGTGKTIYANQTCVYFDEGGIQDHYPGYRIVDIKDGKIGTLSYETNQASIPFYDGSVPGGNTNLDRLEQVSLEAKQVAKGSEYGGAFAWKVNNYLSIPLELKGLSCVMLSDGAVPIEGEIYRKGILPDGKRVYYLRIVVPKGIPSRDGKKGKPSSVTVGIRPQSSALMGSQ